MKNVEFIPRHEYPTCWVCNGKGCETCKYTGKFREEFYYLIYTTKSGQKIAFGVGTLK